jgi:hypothetical protein
MGASDLGQCSTLPTLTLTGSTVTPTTQPLIDLDHRKIITIIYRIKLNCAIHGSQQRNTAALDCGVDEYSLKTGTPITVAHPVAAVLGRFSTCYILGD